MSKVYRTAQGREIDIEKMRLQNEFVPAIGNMKVNARGDQLGPGGAIVKTREEIMHENYNQKLDGNTPLAKDSPVMSRKNVEQSIPTSNKAFVPGNALADSEEKE